MSHDEQLAPGKASIPWLQQNGVGLGLMGEHGAESIHASLRGSSSLCSQVPLNTSYPITFNGIKAEKSKSTSAKMTQLYIGNLPSSADERFIKDLLCKTHSKKKKE